jgi:hypothetical protein
MSGWSFFIIDSDGEADSFTYLPTHVWRSRDACSTQAYEEMCGIFDGPEPDGEWSYDDPEHDTKQYVPRVDRWQKKLKKNRIVSGDMPKGSYFWDVFGDGGFFVVVYPVEIVDHRRAQP